MKLLTQEGRTVLTALSLIVALTLSLTASVQAADQKAPFFGSFHSAKDPDLPPLPFNPHPELSAVEVGNGVYVVDDIAIPDTPEQAAARKARQDAREWAKAIASNPIAAQAAQAAQQSALLVVEQGVFQLEYAPWVVPDLPMPDGSALTWDALDAQNQDRLLSLSTNIANDFVEKQAAVSSFIESNTNISPSWTDDSNNPSSLMALIRLAHPL